jgi:hypothetical protein
VYASTKTGKPSPNNFEYRAVGPNATLAIPSHHRVDTVLYLKILPIDVKQASLVAGSDRSLFKTYRSDKKRTIISTNRDLAEYDRVSALFRVKVPSQSLVSFNITVEEGFTHGPAKYKIFYSDEPSIDFPNEITPSTLLAPMV